jgi:hypothetical protein
VAFPANVLVPARVADARVTAVAANVDVAAIVDVPRWTTVAAATNAEPAASVADPFVDDATVDGGNTGNGI